MVRHLAVIPDGNRRWASARGLAPTDGHRAGLRQVHELAACAFECGVEVFTFWWGSPANLTLREPDEVAGIVSSLREWLQLRAPELLRTWNARLEVVGRWRELCPEIEDGVTAARAAQGAGPRVLVVLMGYDGREEIRAAVVDAAAEGDAPAFESKLWTAALPPVDLVVRAGDAPHLSSGFMLWGIAEAGLAFERVLWPDLSADTLRARIAEHAARPRRHGR